MSCTGVVKSNEALVSWERGREQERGGGGRGDRKGGERERREEKRNLSVFCIHDSFSQH